MPTTPTQTELLTREEADTLSAARRVLREIGKRAAYSVYNLPPVDASYRGRLAEAASVAEDVLFNVLTPASTFTDDAEAARAIERATWRSNDDAS